MADQTTEDISGVAGVAAGVPDDVSEVALRAFTPSGSAVQIRANAGGTLLMDLSGAADVTVGTISQIENVAMLQDGTLSQVQTVNTMQSGTVSQVRGGTLDVVKTLQDQQGGTIDQVTRPRTDFHATLAQDFDLGAAGAPSRPGTFDTAQLDGFSVGFKPAGADGGTFTVEHELRMAPGGQWFKDGQDGSVPTDLVASFTHKAFQYRPNLTLDDRVGSTIDVTARGN